MKNDAEPDKELIARIATGDRAAVQTLFARHQTRVFRFVMRHVRSQSMAEELVNEVFLDVWRQAGRYEGRSSVSTWLLAIARNKALSQLRKRRDAQLDEDYAMGLMDTGDTPDIEVQKSDKADALRQAIDRLTEDHRAVSTWSIIMR